MELLEDISLERQENLLKRLADKIIQMGMITPAIFFLEMNKPLNFIGSQLMLIFEPFAQLVFNYADYHTFVLMMEKRDNIEKLIRMIETRDIELRQQKQIRPAAFGAAEGEPRPEGREDSLSEGKVKADNGKRT